MKDMRLDQMEQYIAEKENVLMEELQNRFNTSLNTVRRDVAILIQKGTVEKVYGGVRAKKADSLIAFDVRTIKHQDAKETIGKKAAELVSDGDIIFLDSGTTTLHMVQNIGQKQNITVITHNLHAIMAAMPFPNLNVISLPGQLSRQTSSFTGMDALRFLSSYNIKTAFMAATGLSSAHGITNASPLEYELKMMAIERSERSILLLDSHKFGQIGLLTYAELTQFVALVTDAMPDRTYLDVLEKSNTRLIIA